MWAVYLLLQPQERFGVCFVSILFCFPTLQNEKGYQGFFFSPNNSEFKVFLLEYMIFNSPFLTRRLRKTIVVIKASRKILHTALCHVLAFCKIVTTFSPKYRFPESTFKQKMIKNLFNEELKTLMECFCSRSQEIKWEKLDWRYSSVGKCLPSRCNSSNNAEK